MQASTRARIRYKRMEDKGWGGERAGKGFLKKANCIHKEDLEFLVVTFEDAGLLTTRIGV